MARQTPPQRYSYQQSKLPVWPRDTRRQFVLIDRGMPWPLVCLTEEKIAKVVRALNACEGVDEATLQVIAETDRDELARRVGA